MSDDEKAIRTLVSTWISASQAGDTATVLSLIAEDAVFLLPGRPPMRKADFAAASSPTASREGPKFEGSSEIQEVQVQGDWAYMWSQLTVVVTPPGGKPIKRAGPTLTILRKEGGRWLLARDANMLSIVPDSM